MRYVAGRRLDDEGMTLMEMIVTSSILLVVLIMVFISMNLINSLSTSVSNQYQEFNQVIPAMTPFRTLLSAEVEPAPPNGSGTPTPPFAAIGNFSMTFYANVGTGFDNTTSCQSGSCQSGGTTAGPAKIAVVELDGNGNPATACNVQAPCSLQVRLYLPIVGVVGPGISTCPGVSPTGTACQYPSTYRLMANVQDVVNDPSQVDGNGAPTDPLFTYTLFDTTYDQAIQLTPLEVQNQMITGLTNSSTYSPAYPVDSQSLTACASATANPSSYPTLAVSCPADAVQSVQLDLQVAKPGTSTNGTVEDNLTVYRYAQSPGASISPFQYQAAVG